MNYNKSVVKWGLIEISCHGKTDGNPFVEYSISGTFIGKNETVKVDGFYDGNGTYLVRFMPSFEGMYHFIIQGSALYESFSGQFDVTEPDDNNHGPVRVVNTYHFCYEDATSYIPIGTTCYVWHLQNDEMIRQTLESLKNSSFNKIRFCIFPKHYEFNLMDPRSFPYEGKPMDSSVLTTDNFREYTGKIQGNAWNFYRFNVEYFQHIDQCIIELQKLGIEADLIIMHPYDRWGFSQMTREQDDLYLQYVVARFSAYRNVWWSLANEYDTMENKTILDWEHYAQILTKKDAYNHLRSIHNCRAYYDYSRPWVTHCSIQRIDIYKTAELTNEYRERYKKPVVLDEIAYEGNLEHGWGNITPQEMVRRFWEAAVRGGYPQHSETYLNDSNKLWWSHGGILHGKSWKRMGFLLDIIKSVPGGQLKLKPECKFDEVCGVPDNEASNKKVIKDYYLYYYSFMTPLFRTFYFDNYTRFTVDVIDTWNMTITGVGTFKGKFVIPLGAKQYMAIRLRKTDEIED